MIGNRWYTKDEWNHHIDTKNQIKEAIDQGNLELLKNVEVDPSTIMPQNKLNYDFLVDLRDVYAEILDDYHPTFFEKLLGNKVWDIACSLFTTDSFYHERIGYFIQLIVLNPAIVESSGNLWLLEEMRTRYLRYECRPSRISYIEFVFNQAITFYQKSDFACNMINRMLVEIVARKDAWVSHEMYEPNNWYGYEKGCLTLDLCGREHH